MKRFLIILIKIYKLILSPVLSKKLRCRFYPTCSDYAIMSLNKYGSKIGIKKVINRLCRCNPYNGESCIDYP
jgi:putative membrane protein insertion efficiency factor